MADEDYPKSDTDSASYSAVPPNFADESGRSAQVLTKRVKELARNILIVSSIALIVFLTNVDSGDYRADYEALNTLSELSDISVSAANPDYKFNEWLAEKEPTLVKDCNEARSSLIHDLSQCGFDKETLHGNIDEWPASYSAVDIVFSDAELEFMTRQPGSTYHMDVDKARNVGQLLDRFELVHAPRGLAVVRRVKLPEEKPQPQSQPGSRPDSERRYSQIRGFHTDRKRNGMVVQISHPEPAGYRDRERRQAVLCPAEIVSVDGLSLAEAMDLETPSGVRLFRDPEHRSRLRAIYGELDVQSAMSITSEQFVRSYKQVEILGMSFSAKRLPMAMCAILLILVACLYITVRQATALPRRMVAKVFEASPMEMIVDWFPVRVIALVLLPLVAIWASHPPFPLGVWDYAVLGTGTFTILVFCVGSLVGIRRLQNDATRVNRSITGAI